MDELMLFSRAEVPHSGTNKATTWAAIVILQDAIDGYDNTESNSSQLTPRVFRFGEYIWNTLSAALSAKLSYLSTAAELPISASAVHHVASRDYRQSEKPPSNRLCCLQPWSMLGLSTPHWKALPLPTAITAKSFLNTESQSPCRLEVADFQLRASSGSIPNELW